MYPYNACYKMRASYWCRPRTGACAPGGHTCPPGRGHNRSVGQGRALQISVSTILKPCWCCEALHLVVLGLVLGTGSRTLCWGCSMAGASLCHPCRCRTCLQPHGVSAELEASQRPNTGQCVLRSQVLGTASPLPMQWQS
jgi:hypothetical protein